MVIQPIDDSPFGRAAAEVEKAYRRGFYQGAARAVEAVESGAPLGVVSDWIYGAVAAWRRKGVDWKPGGRVKAVTPPAEPCGPVYGWQRFLSRLRGAAVRLPGKA